MKKKSSKNIFKNPDAIPLTTKQALRLGSTHNISADALKGLSISDLLKDFPWDIDPALLGFKKICGRVVKRDAGTGELHPVPFATVHVEDTDCDLMGFFPPDSPWSWFFPLSCHREEITQVRTDACGHFCVYIPRFDIDWILRWRKERLCFPVIFERPRLRDILPELHPVIPEPFPHPPGPQPDPIPWIPKAGPALNNIRQLIGTEKAEQLLVLQDAMQLGDSSLPITQLLDSPAFEQAMPPPLPSEIRSHIERREFSEIKARVPQFENVGDEFNHRYFIGPFKRCRDVLLPEWQRINDIPDITFRVSQDVDGDGDEEDIYTESWFDIRWDAETIPDVTLEVSQNALIGVDCESPEALPCGTAAIVLAGKMPLHNIATEADYIDSSGYAKRVNRPHPSGQYNETVPPGIASASAPMAGVFPLYGCNQHEGAEYYRLRYVHTPENSSTPLAKRTFEGHSWNLYRWTDRLERKQVTPDADGWYPVLDPDDGWMPAYLLLNWPTTEYDNGLYEIEMELANSSKSLIHSTASVKLHIDNSRPQPGFTRLRWRTTGGSWQEISMICPVIQRPPHQDIQIEVRYEAAASHLRSLKLSGHGCGAGNALQLSNPAISPNWWHRNASENNESRTAVFNLQGSASAGAYGFHISAYSRAFRPVSAQGLSSDWYINLNDIWKTAELHIAVVDAL